VCARAANDREACGHTKSYELRAIERDTVEHVRSIFADPAMIKRFVTVYEAEFAEVQRRAKQETGNVDRRLAEVEAAIGRLAYALAAGGVSTDILLPKLQALETERAGLKERRRLADVEVTKIAMHPAALARWQNDLEFFAQRLDDKSVTPEARGALRNLLDHVLVHPTRRRMPYQIEPRIRRSALASPAQNVTVLHPRRTTVVGTLLSSDSGATAQSVSS
jgi:hypothetical protein